MKIGIVSDLGSWIWPYASELAGQLSGKYKAADGHAEFAHHVTLIHKLEMLEPCEVVFLLGATTLAPPELLSRHGLVLVVHESALPQGRGWAPVQWQILEGKTTIPVSLFQATPEVDGGPIYLTDAIELDGTELFPEIRRKQAAATGRLVRRFVERWPNVEPREQTGTPSFYPRRTSKDDAINPHKTIADQFDKLRLVDNERYPAWFEFRGRRYRLKIEAD